MIDIRLPAKGERWRLKPGRTAARHPVVTIDGIARKVGVEWVLHSAQLRPGARMIAGDRLDEFLRAYEPDEGPS